jgi:hypothetical protein
MAANLSNRVLYRSPDALQNLRLKVTLTRVSGPRMDRAREMDERFGAGPTPQAQIQAQQQQAQAATSLAPPGPPLASQPPAPSTPPARARTAPVAELRRRRARGRGRRRIPRAVRRGPDHDAGAGRRKPPQPQRAPAVLHSPPRPGHPTSSNRGGDIRPVRRGRRQAGHRELLAAVDHIIPRFAPGPRDGGVDGR